MPSEPTPTNAPSASKPTGFFRRLLHRGVKPTIEVAKTANPSESAAQQSPTPEKKELSVNDRMNEAMDGLRARNQELGGHLVNEFGEGKTKFMVLSHPLSNDGTRHQYNPYPGGTREEMQDYLVATQDGFQVLQIREGEWRADPKFPQYETVLHRTKQDDIFSGAIARLVGRGRAVRPDEPAWLRSWGSTQGSGYAHNGNVSSLNFGEDVSVDFSSSLNHPEVAFYRGVTPKLGEFILKDPNATGGITRSIESGAALLVVEPDPTHVAEIMEHNLTEAKTAYDTEQEKLLQEARQKLQQEISPAAPQPTPAEPNEAKKLEAATAVLDLLKGSGS
ncbi:MAG: hypothetical protein HY429_01970 [Candidatus Levybacteria bacterium]|nr:hypothetical protein [Candidatus Levybacteria bacterium]